MLSHLHYESFLDWVPAIAFALSFGVFAFSALRLWRMDSSRADRAARLPLESEQPRPGEKQSY